jgi:hypothetical protein
LRDDRETRSFQHVYVALNSALGLAKLGLELVKRATEPAGKEGHYLPLPD